MKFPAIKDECPIVAWARERGVDVGDARKAAEDIRALLREQGLVGTDEQVVSVLSRIAFHRKVAA